MASKKKKAGPQKYQKKRKTNCQIKSRGGLPKSRQFYLLYLWVKR